MHVQSLWEISFNLDILSHPTGDHNGEILYTSVIFLLCATCVMQEAGIVTREQLSEVSDNYFSELNQTLKTSAEHSPNVLFVSPLQAA